MRVRTDDTGHVWTVRISDGPVVTTAGEAPEPEPPQVEFAGTAVQLYLGLWNRGEEITTNGRPDIVEQWRSHVRVRWS